MIIDVHTHHALQGRPDLGRPGASRLRMESESEVVIILSDHEFRRIQDDRWSAPVRPERMDADGVNVQIVSPAPVFSSYERPAAQAAGVARVFDDLAPETCVPDTARAELLGGNAVRPLGR